MKRTNFFLFAILVAALNFTSCKGKDKKDDIPADTPATTTTTPETPAVTTAPVVVSSDEQLRKGVTDATKDYPGVKAEVTDSVIVLTGEIKRADWQKLNPTLNSLHPKRVNSTNLTIK